MTEINFRRALIYSPWTTFIVIVVRDVSLAGQVRLLKVVLNIAVNTVADRLQVLLVRVLRPLATAEDAQVGRRCHRSVGQTLSRATEQRSSVFAFGNVSYKKRRKRKVLVLKCLCQKLQH